MRHGPFELIDAHSEGDVGIWFLGQHENDEVALLLEARWVFALERVRVGCRRLTLAAWDSLPVTLRL